jgi:hypothetical protein
MKKTAIILALLVYIFVSCDNKVIDKPNQLIKEKQMIDMLYDLHIAEATYNRMRYDSIVKNSSSANFYYSVLEKYETPDSVFEKSFIYYSSTPKNFEKMYREVMNKLSESEQSYSGRKNEILEFDTPKK